MSPRYRTRKPLKCSGQLSSAIRAIELGAMRSLRQWQKPTQPLLAHLRPRFERLRGSRLFVQERMGVLHVRLNQLQPLQARVTFLADDDVVMNGNAERLRH